MPAGVKPGIYALAGTSPRRCTAASRGMVLIGSAQEALGYPGP